MLPLLFYFMKVEDGILECMCKVAHDQSEELGVDVVHYFWIYIMICMDEVIGASEIVNIETGLAYDDQFMLFKIGSEPSIIQGNIFEFNKLWHKHKKRLSLVPGLS